MDYIYDQLVQDYGAITFEAFINLLASLRTLTLHALLMTVGSRLILRKIKRHPSSCGKHSVVSPPIKCAAFYSPDPPSLTWPDNRSHLSQSLIFELPTFRRMRSSTCVR
jgi:hypothetical protein